MKKFLILILVVLIMSIGGYYYFNNGSNNSSFKDSISKNNINDKVLDIIDNYNISFKGNISNSQKLDEEVLDVIVKYMDCYYSSIYNLDVCNTSNLFSDKIEGYISDTAIKMVVESRKLYNHDFKMKKAHYDLDIADVSVNNGVYTIDFYEDDSFNFNFLSVESKAYDIDNTMTIEKVNGEYKIKKYRKVQDYYIMYTNNTPFNSKLEIDKLYNDYYNDIKDEIEYEKKLLEESKKTEYSPKKICNYSYDRDSAKEYSYKYNHQRNNEWYDYSNIGGNCQNYASQVIYNGGVNMDYMGNILYQWKHYSSNVNSNEVQDGRSYSWTAVQYFYTYAKENDGFGLCSEVDVNLFYAEPGDIIQVGYDGYGHTVVVADRENDYILINSNTIDLENFPLDAYVYQNKRLIKILGSN